MWVSWNGGGVSPTLTRQNAGGQQRMPDKDNMNAIVENTDYIIRRLTPLECCRLQGMPDGWTHLTPITDMSDQDVEFWNKAREERAKLDGKSYKQQTKKQMISWYNKLQTDSAEYKAYGNGLASSCAKMPMRRLANQGVRTMASLFDGIGGFPYAASLYGIECKWTSEIELFPIAVTKERFK